MSQTIQIDESESYLQYLVQGELFNNKRKHLLLTNSSNGIVASLPTHPFMLDSGHRFLELPSNFWKNTSSVFALITKLITNDQNLRHP